MTKYIKVKKLKFAKSHAQFKVNNFVYFFLICILQGLIVPSYVLTLFNGFVVLERIFFRNNFV